MRRRARIGGHAAKKRPRKSVKPRRAPKGERSSGPSAAHLQEQVYAVTRELIEAREEQAATSEVLQVISSAPGELEPVFQAILANATRICDAKFGNLWLREGDALDH